METVADNQLVTSTRAVILSGSGDELRILLVRRKFPPFDGLLTLPGGFLKEDRNSLETIKQKVLKETSVDLGTNYSCYKLSSRSHNQDPRGVQVTDNFLFTNNEEVDCDQIELSGDERPEWYYLDEVERLGFNHGAVLCEALGVLWSNLPVKIEKKPAIELPRAYSAKEIDWKSSVVFFSGTFDPWHEGHQACLDLCPNKNVVIVPDTNPWKMNSSSSKRCYWKEYRSLAQRVQRDTFCVYPGYFGLEDGNPTVNWLPNVNCKKKEFLMGLDSFTTFPRWKNVEQLVESISKLYVVPRNIKNSGDSGEVVNKVKEIKSNFKISFLEEHSFMDVSSSELRKGN